MPDTNESPVRPAIARGNLKPLALYAHIPFCKTKCPYCDFLSCAGAESLIQPYVDAIQAELRWWSKLLQRPPLSTVFFGGGTPSLLPAESVESLLQAIRDSFEADYLREVSIEVNPGDLTPAKTEAYIVAGVNRLSIGVQSFDDHLLKVLGRRHTSSQAKAVYRMAQQTGINNISIDLMFGLPYQGLEDWRQTLVQAIRLRPSHISAYCLTIEAGTPFDLWIKSRRLPEPDPDLEADMYLLAEELLKTGGYRHYEISNWALPGKECAHNLTYWHNEPYLGVGSAAHSYLGGFRFRNLASPGEYIVRLSRYGENATGTGINAGTLEAMPVVEGVEHIDRVMEMAETMMLGLRLDAGIPGEMFLERFRVSPHEVYGGTIDELVRDGLLDAGEEALKLTPRGRILGNEVFSRFFA